jgi:predicted dehydrogenase
MVEKPVALHRHEAEAVLRAQQDSDCYITSNLILRRSPRFVALREMIAAGRFGDIFYLEGDYIHQILWKIVTGWRAKMDFYCVTYGGGIHLIDLLRWMLREEVVEVCGMGNKLLTRVSDFRYPDTIVNLLRFEGGALAKSLTTFGPQRPQIHALNIYGTRLTFVNDLPDGKLFEGDDPADEAPLRIPYPAVEKGDLLPDFVEAIRDRREPEVGARDIFRVMDVCFAAWESVQAGRTVKVSYLI